MYLDCVHSAGISYSSAGDQVTASSDSLVLLDCHVCSFEGKQGCCEESLPGVTFRNEIQTAWNAPESYVTLDSPGVVELDTSVVWGLRTRNQNTGPTRVLPGRAQNSVCVLIPDVRAAPRGFHEVTLVDMTGETGPEVSMEEMGLLRRQWPTSPLLTGMSRRQADLETQWR